MMISQIWTMILTVVLTVTVILTMTVNVTIPMTVILTMSVPMSLNILLILTLTMPMTMSLLESMILPAIRQCIAEVCFPPGQLGSEERASLDHRSHRDRHPSIPVSLVSTLAS
jgi:hypothetical protein